MDLVTRIVMKKYFHNFPPGISILNPIQIPPHIPKSFIKA